MIKNFIAKLQDKPYETRVKILWGSVLVVGVILLMIWIWSLKTTIGKINGSDLIKITNTDTPATSTLAQTPYASVERVEQSAANLKIYFNFNNPTDDILNVSKLENISLAVDGNSIKPQKIQDRQGRDFVQKILFRTQNFGILIFSNTTASGATLTFDQMFFEKNAADIFKQTLDLDFNKLNNHANLRN